MGFSIVVIGLVILQLANIKDTGYDDNDIKPLKYLILFFIIFIVASLFYYLLLSLYKNNEEKSYLQNYNNNIAKDYQIISQKFQTVAETMFETTLNNQQVKQLIKNAYTDKKDLSRQHLYSLLKDRYDYFKKYNVRQLHFHLKNNESFLRFHRPGKYGDNLTGIRSTVEWVNEHHFEIQGFEEGRIFNGFRYVFPLSYLNDKMKKEHVGSVEVSFSAQAIIKVFSSSHHSNAGFLVSKDVVGFKVFNEEKSNYSQSVFENFYHENSIKKQFQLAFEHFDTNMLSKENIKTINDKIFDGEIFSVLSNSGNSLFTFIPLKNPVNQKTVAAIVLQIDNTTINKQNDFFLLVLFAGIITILLILIFLYREFTLKLKFLDLSIKTQHILDTQKSIVVITNGITINDVNKKFLEFFNYPSLNDFKKKYNCICDHFIKDDNYFSLAKINDGDVWVKELKNIPDQDRVVLLRDSKGIEHSFAITISDYKEQYFIVTFTDISGTMQNQLILEKQVILDKLTGAYNREFFEKKTPQIIVDNQANGKFLGLIIFDIDHFKLVNDTYGHNVGDYILKELVNRVMFSIRDSDYLVRWGGEEFIVLISTRSLDEAESTAQHLRSMIEHHKFDHVNNITCSFGVTLYIEDEPLTTTVERADKALYFSKENGRNMVTKL
ncbi:diguanylate cyclase [Sulfurimonas sp.]